MKSLLPTLLLSISAVYAQTHPLQRIIEAARTNSSELKDLIATGIPGLKGRDGAVVWGQDFLFVVESEKPASVSIDKQPAIAMTNVPGTKYWYKLMTLRLGTTHNYNYIVDGRSIGTYDVAGYNPDSYPLPGVARGTISEKKTLDQSDLSGNDGGLLDLCECRRRHHAWRAPNDLAGRGNHRR